MQENSSTKSYLTSLRTRLKQFYEARNNGDTDVHEDWINGFMAAGHHSGIVTLSQLKIEHMSAYRKVAHKIMTEQEESSLEIKLSQLCEVWK